MYTGEKMNNKLINIERRANEIVERIKQHIYQAHDLLQRLPEEDRKILKASLEI